jgi:hypothetical protein
MGELLRTGLEGSALVGLLSGLALLDGPASRPSFVQGMGRWLGWVDAIPLAAALNTPWDGATTPSRRASPAGAAEREFERVRGALLRSIEDATASSGRQRRAAAVDDSDFASHRQRYVALQQAMHAAIEPLRGQVRAAVAQQSAERGRLAALDAVMAQVFAPREQELLGLMPTLLEPHFERLRRAAPAAPPTQWLAAFRIDMQRLLLAELELRLQPVQGLIDALRNPPQGST